MNERGGLHPGNDLPTIDIPHPDGRITAGVQLCREIRFPEQWQCLATAGAQLFVYLTNAANAREPEGVWRSHLISRAAGHFDLLWHTLSMDEIGSWCLGQRRHDVLSMAYHGHAGRPQNAPGPAQLA